MQAYENAQGNRDAQLKVSELESQLTDIRTRMTEKIEESERESSTAKRAQEEASILRKKIDKYKTREQSSLGDEVLLEEIKMYKVRMYNNCTYIWVVYVLQYIIQYVFEMMGFAPVCVL